MATNSHTNGLAFDHDPLCWMCDLRSALGGNKRHTWAEVDAGNIMSQALGLFQCQSLRCEVQSM
eukprot:1018120-Karenia_brevis.AAC.1